MTVNVLKIFIIYISAFSLLAFLLFDTLPLCLLVRIEQTNENREGGWGWGWKMKREKQGQIEAQKKFNLRYLVDSSYTAKNCLTLFLPSLRFSYSSFFFPS